MVKKTEAPEPEQAEPTPTPTVAARKPGLLVLATVIVGAVLIAGGLFGGGVLVGLALPNGHSQGPFERPDFGGVPGDGPSRHDHAPERAPDN